MKLLLIILLTILASLVAAPAFAGPLCHRLGGCGAGHVQGPVQKGYGEGRGFLRRLPIVRRFAR